MRRRAISLLFLSAFVPSLWASDVSYEEETKMGGLGKIATFGRAMKSRTEVSGGFMRTETGSEATIVDLAQEKIFTLDTKKKTYTEMTFAEMRQKLESAMKSAQARQGEATSKSESSDVSASTDVRVTETGRSEVIDGRNCRQFLLELDVKLESEKEKQSGTMTMLNELWVANDVPGVDEVQAFQQKMAAKLGTRALAQNMFGSGDGNRQTPFGSGADMQRMAEEMKKINGFPMRTVVYFGSGDAAKKEAMGEKPAGGGGLGGMLKKMSIPGAGGGSEQGGEAGDGAVMMRVTTETTKIETKSIDAKRFAVPGDYKKVESR